jgi:REP element-mobilizing transposase RayT
MAQSYCNLVYHVVFSTKRRTTWLGGAVAPRVRDYLGGAIRGEGGVCLAVNIAEDHVHLLVRLRQDKGVSDVVRGLKAGSSAWIHKTFDGLDEFAWQSGYGAFTVSESQVDKVRQYIANQPEHHRTVTFKEEFVALLKTHGIEFEEKYLWE